MEPVETVVAVAFGVLGAVFLATLGSLLFICYCRMCLRNAAGPMDAAAAEFSPERILVEGVDPDDPRGWGGFELDDVELAPQINKILNDTQWVDDVTGLIPHSLGILKLCHQLTERLLVPALAGTQKDRLHEIIQLSRRVSPRIDDVASAMYPPLDPRLLEARCSALTLTVHLLVWHAHATHPSIFETLARMEKHLAVLREAAMSQETVLRVFRDENVEDQKKY